MRKIFSTVMLVAAAAMTFASCQREEMNAPKETFSTTLTLNTEVDATKTYLGADNTVLWGENESVTLFVKDSNEEPATTFVKSASTSDFNGKASASFTFELTGIAESASYTIGGIYPESVSNGIDNKNAAAYKINLPATQNASVDNYDPSAFIMVLKPETVETVPSTYTASFRRAVALNKITLTGVKENMSSVEITVEPSQEGLYLAGRRYVDLTTAEFGDIYYGQTNTVTVNAPYTGSSIDVWFTSWGMDLKSGDKLTVKMTSATKTYTRTITANENGIKFVEGDLNTLTVNMSSATEETLANNSGQYLVAAKKGDYWALMAPTATDFINALTTSVAYTNKECAAFYEVAGIDDYVWTVTAIDGGYSVCSYDGKYVSFPTGGKNNAVLVDSPASLSLEIDDAQKATVIDMGSGRMLMYNSSSPRFAFYTSGQTDIYFIPWVADTTPRIFVTSEHEQSIGADGGEVKFEYTLKNLSGQSLTVEETSDFVSASVAAGVVTATVSANTTTESRNATLTLKCGEAASVSVTIIQAGKQAEGVAKEYTVTYTVSTKTAVTTSGTAPTGSNATFAATYSTATQMTASNTQTYTLSGYAGCVIKSVTLSMHANSSKGAGKLSLKAGNQTLASISSATDFNKWYNNTTFGTDWRDVNVTLTNDSYNIGANENVVLVLTGTTNSIYCQSVTITYEATGSAEGGESPDPEQPTGPQTHLYTFTSKSWADNTNSWTSGKDGNQMQSGRGVQVTTGASGANATGKSSMSNVSKVVVVYSTNASAGAGKIKISIGNTELESAVTKTGGTSDRSLEFDFTSSYPTGIPKITVTCTTNSIYVKSVEITTN